MSRTESYNLIPWGCPKHSDCNTCPFPDDCHAPDILESKSGPRMDRILHAQQLLQEGKTPEQVGKDLHVSKRTVMRWQNLTLDKTKTCATIT